MPSLVAPDGTTLVFEASEPPHARAALLFLTGWSDHAGRWADFAVTLRDAGLATYALDFRGHGRSGGRRGHLSRFSQLLGDLKAFRRAVRQRGERPQVLLGHSFGGLVALRYLETQPGDPIAAAAVSSPFLGLGFQPPWWKVAAGRILADLWPSVGVRARIDADHLSRDAAVNAAYRADPLVHDLMTPGAWREIAWAQRAVPADAHRIEVPLLFQLAGEDRIVDPHLARAFADGLQVPADVHWYPEMYHEIFHDPRREQPIGDLLAFLAQRGVV